MSPVLFSTRAERLGVLGFALAALAVTAALVALGYSRITGAFEPPPADLTDNQQARHVLQSTVELICGVLLLAGVFGVSVLAALMLVASGPHDGAHSVHIAMKLSVLAVLVGLLVLPITQMHGGPAPPDGSASASNNPASIAAREGVTNKGDR